MGIETDGRGLTSEQRDAVTASLVAMDEPDARVILTDDFVGTIRRLISSDAYSAARGDGVVAGKTVDTDSGPVIVFNAPELRDRGGLVLIERTAAHVHLITRGESTSADKESLVDRHWRWLLLQTGGYALEEYRIERAVIDLGYPVSESGAVEYVGEALTTLNAEIVDALLNDASEDPRAFAAAVLSTQSWVTAMLAYATAGAGNSLPKKERGWSNRAAEPWDEYIGNT